jgi:hypothetical protein
MAPPIRNLAITSLTSGGRSVGIVRSRTKATELLVYYLLYAEWKLETWYRMHIIRCESESVTLYVISSIDRVF